MDTCLRLVAATSDPYFRVAYDMGSGVLSVICGYLMEYIPNSSIRGVLFAAMASHFVVCVRACSHDTIVRVLQGCFETLETIKTVEGAFFKRLVLHLLHYYNIYLLSAGVDRYSWAKAAGNFSVDTSWASFFEKRRLWCSQTQARVLFFECGGHEPSHMKIEMRIEQPPVVRACVSRTSSNLTRLANTSKPAETIDEHYKYWMQRDPSMPQEYMSAMCNAEHFKNSMQQMEQLFYEDFLWQVGLHPGELPTPSAESICTWWLDPLPELAIDKTPASLGYDRLARLEDVDLMCFEQL